MSQFEYLNRVSIGQYLPLNSFVHQRNPAIKLVSFTFLILSIALTRQLNGLLFSIAILLLLLALSKTPFKYVWRGILTPLPFILILSILQLFLASHRSQELPLFSLWIFSITTSGIRFAISMCLRFIALVILLSISSATLSTLEMVYGLDILSRPLKIFRINTSSAAMVVQIMLRFIPILALNAEKIAKSQASRGALWDASSKGSLFNRARQLLPLIIPLFSISLQQADTLANAMLARAYGSNIKRTGLYQYQLGLLDGFSLLMVILISYFVLFFPL